MCPTCMYMYICLPVINDLYVRTPLIDVGCGDALCSPEWVSCGEKVWLGLPRTACGVRD